MWQKHNLKNYCQTLNFKLSGKVKRLIETSKKLGDERTQKEKEDTNTIYVHLNYNIIETLTFKELGNVIDKQELPNNKEKTVYTYDK